MSDETTNYEVEVTIVVSEKLSYETKPRWSATVKDRATWDELKPTAIRFALDGMIEDVQGRVARQLRDEAKRRKDAEIAAAAEAAESVPF